MGSGCLIGVGCYGGLVFHLSNIAGLARILYRRELGQLVESRVLNFGILLVLRCPTLRVLIHVAHVILKLTQCLVTFSLSLVTILSVSSKLSSVEFISDRL